MLGIFGIILAFVVFTIFCYKNMSAAYAAALAAIVVMVFNGMAPHETFIELYPTGMTVYLQAYFLTIILGTIVGRIYTVSGAGVSIAEALSRAFLRPSLSGQKRQLVALLVMTFAGGVLAYGGINIIVLIFTLYPLMLRICEIADIPKRFIAGIAMSGTCTWVLSSPGSPQMANFVPMTELGTSSTAALIPGIVGAIAVIAVATIVMNAMITKAKKNGEKFAYGPKDKQFEEGVARPHWLIAILPLITIWFTFNFLELHLVFSQVCGVVLACILFIPYCTGKGRDGYISIFNTGSVDGIKSGMTVAMVMGFAYVIRSSAGFGLIIDTLLGMAGSPYVTFPIAVALASASAGSASAGQILLLPTLAPHYIAAGVPAAALHRLGAAACTTIDSLPTNPTVQLFLEHTDENLKSGYPACFVASVLATTAGTIVVALMLYAFPWMAV